MPFWRAPKSCMAHPDGHRTIRVEVIYALPDAQEVIPVELTGGASLQDAVTASGILGRYAGIEPGVTAVGIFGRRADWDIPLEDGDRVEIYRPLVADPKEQRRKRVRRQRVEAR